VNCIVHCLKLIHILSEMSYEWTKWVQ
jgi:hypothetical protein